MTIILDNIVVIVVVVVVVAVVVDVADESLMGERTRHKLICCLSLLDATYGITTANIDAHAATGDGYNDINVVVERDDDWWRVGAV